MTDLDRQNRSRLVDHFKRVYTIIAGLAITEAVRRLFPLPDHPLDGPAIWLFLTFFITIVPIFHGGDRSLDLKYLDEPRNPGWPRIWFLWDVYMLLITAMLFVGIAEAIPKPTEKMPVAAITASDTKLFFVLMAGTLAFDVVILIVDKLKSDQATRDLLLPYPTWISINTMLAVICVIGALAAARADAAGTICVLGHQMDLTYMFPLIAVLAFLRTVKDYHVGSRFLFC